jgi:hypothetical protein
MGIEKKNGSKISMAKVIYYIILIVLVLLISIAIATKIFLPTIDIDKESPNVNQIENTK